MHRETSTSEILRDMKRFPNRTVYGLLSKILFQEQSHGGLLTIGATFSRLCCFQVKQRFDMSDREGIVARLCYLWPQMVHYDSFPQFQIAARKHFKNNPGIRNNSSR
jgi:hypothetical protein